MKIPSLVPTVVLATHVLGGLISGNASSDIHFETAGRVDQGSSRWPIITETPPGGRNMVRYCFSTPQTKSNFEPLFLRAIDLWITALGGPASPQTGHNLAFREFQTPEGFTPSCCTTEIQISSRGQYICSWNPHVENDVLAIFPSEMPHTSYATIGYIAGSKEKWLASFERRPHRIHFHRLSSPHSMYLYAHELGHVFGLLHEHQRIDRDNYIVFYCRNIVDFWRAFDAARRDRDEQRTGDSDEELERKLCTSSKFAARFRFMGAAFATDVGSNPDRDPVAHGPYDPDSIMHYSSVMGIRYYNPNDPNECPQVPWKCSMALRDPTNPMALSNIRDNTIPSAGDLAVVRRLYPFRV